MSRRRSSRRLGKIKPYLLIVLACAVLATVMHILSAVPDRVQDYAEGRVDEAVRKAVRSEVKEATRQTP